MLRVLLASQRSFLFEPLHFDSSHQRSTDRDVFRFCELTHFNFSIFYHSRIGWLRSIQESWRRIHESFRVELIFNGFVFRFIDARCAKPIKLRRGLIFSFFFFFCVWMKYTTLSFKSLEVDEIISKFCSEVKLKWFLSIFVLCWYILLLINFRVFLFKVSRCFQTFKR